MAKRSRSVALFEVINKDKRFDRRGGVLPTPAWFKSSVPNPVATGAKVDPPPIPVAVTAAAVPPPAPKPTAPTAVPATPPPASEIRPDENDSWPVVDTNDGFAPIHNGAAEKRGRQNSPFTKTSVAIIAASALLVVSVGLAYSHWFGRGPNIPDGTAILKGAAHPDVLNLAVAKPVEAPIPTPVPAPAATLAADTQSPTRQVGLNYVLIHLYQSRRAAALVCDYLNRHGIPCTVEHDIRGVVTQFYAVVGLTPFAHTGSADYVEYIQKTKLLIGKLSGTTQSVRAFKPRLLKWTQQAD